MCIFFYPFDLSYQNNPYIKRICQSIHYVDKSIEIKPLSFKNWKRPKPGDFFWLNWYENLGSESFYLTLRTFIIKMYFFLLMKMSAGKIIMVLHNKEPHEVLFKQLSKYFIRFLLLHSDRIIILCQDSEKIIKRITNKDLSYKTKKILHPAYPCFPKKYENIPTQPFRVLFIGLIRPYKNIELLLDIAKIHPEFEFFISGKPLNKKYASALEFKSSTIHNVVLDLKYNSDNEIEAMMDNSSVLVLPYHMNSTLNSGIAMYAFSKGLNVVMPAIGTVNELHSKECVFYYNYNTAAEHFEALNAKIMEAYDLYVNDYPEFIKRSEIVRLEVVERCSVSAISSQIELSGVLNVNSYLNN